MYLSLFLSNNLYSCIILNCKNTKIVVRGITWSTPATKVTLIVDMFCFFIIYVCVLLLCV